jgi:hypothetical protein
MAHSRHLDVTRNFVFIRDLLNDDVNSSDYIMSNNERMIMNNELERIWKEAVMA